MTIRTCGPMIVVYLPTAELVFIGEPEPVAWLELKSGGYCPVAVGRS